MDLELIAVYQHGIYYNPAWKHYGRETNVCCDRCKSSNLNICIGYRELDLCLVCVNEISRFREYPKIITKMQQSIFKPSLPGDDAYDPYDDMNYTLMTQSMYNPHDKKNTYMVQGMYDPLRNRGAKRRDK